MNCTCKLPVKGSERLCIINTDWTETGADLLLIHNNKAWSGKFQIDEIEDIADILDQLALSKEMYLRELKNALTSNEGNVSFEFSIENEKFTWKKRIRKNMTVKYGSIHIFMLPAFDVFEQITNNILQTLINTSGKLDESVKEKQVLEEENFNLNTKINQLIDKKSEMETTLYSQFLCVLNEKKKKIKELKHKLDPSELQVNDSDENLSGNDHFGSETEIDSEDDGHTHSSLDGGENKLGALAIKSSPKRSRISGKTESVSGPSLIVHSNSKLKEEGIKKTRVSQVRRLKKQTKLQKKTKVEEVVTKNNSHDEFVFLKQSRRTDSSIKKNIPYESDEEPTGSKNIKKSEPDMDSISTNKVEASTVSKIEEVKSTYNDAENSVEKYKLDQNNKLDVIRNSPGRIPRSVLNVLDQLME